jgi:predicted permease
LVLLVLAATGLLLLIAGANVANLLLVRTTGRGNEVLMRKALGAGRMRLASQYLTESMVLAGLGAVAGLGLGVWGAQALAAAMPQALLPAYVEIRPDLGVFLMAAGLMTVVGVLAGLAPAILAARSDLASGLREGSQGSLGRRRALIQKGLVVVEVALALLLMVGAGLMTRSFGAQLDIQPGFDHEELYAFRMTLPPEPYSGDALRAAMQEIDERLEAVPGVTAVTFGSSAPLRGGYSAAYLFVEGSSAEDRIRFYLQRVAPDWMETLGTGVIRGRALEMADLDNPEVTVISQALAERFFPGQDPVGQTIRVGRPDGLQLAIVGVAEDVRYRDLTTDLVAGADDPDIYLPWDRFATRTVDVVLRTAADPATLERTVREVVAGFDPDLPVFLAQPMSQSLRNQTAQARFGTVLLGTFSGLAALLALVGLYGVLAFAVDQRRREIAVRMAIGAEATRVRQMIVGQGMKLAAGGLVLGLGAAFLASRSLEAFLYGVEPVDLGTYATVAALMTVIGFLAAWLPARRATRVDPQRALNTE